MNMFFGSSIKSQLGNQATLLHGSSSTNFIYSLSGNQSCKIIDKVNSINTSRKVQDRIKAILKDGCEISFLNTEEDVFYNNLILIDSLLPKILAEVLIQYYTSGSVLLKDLVKNLELKNPLGFNQEFGHEFYTFKLKGFLADLALGMIPEKVWTGRYDAIIDFIEGKDILEYRTYDLKDFENYLLNHTKLETASSSRHDFGKIYEENGELFFKLNLQIRFIK